MWRKHACHIGFPGARVTVSAVFMDVLNEVSKQKHREQVTRPADEDAVAGGWQEANRFFPVENVHDLLFAPALQATAVTRSKS